MANIREQKNTLSSLAWTYKMDVDEAGSTYSTNYSLHYLFCSTAEWLSEPFIYYLKTVNKGAPLSSSPIPSPLSSSSFPSPPLLFPHVPFTPLPSPALPLLSPSSPIPFTPSPFPPPSFPSRPLSFTSLRLPPSTS